jgi:hypothetical protein
MLANNSLEVLDKLVMSCLAEIVEEVICFVNILCGLIAYCHQPKKPGIAME